MRRRRLDQGRVCPVSARLEEAVGAQRPPGRHRPEPMADGDGAERHPARRHVEHGLHGRRAEDRRGRPGAAEPFRAQRDEQRFDGRAACEDEQVPLGLRAALVGIVVAALEVDEDGEQCGCAPQDPVRPGDPSGDRRLREPVLREVVPPGLRHRVEQPGHRVG